MLAPTPNCMRPVARRLVIRSVPGLCGIFALVLGPVLPTAQAQMVTATPSLAHMTGHAAMGAEWIRSVAGAIGRIVDPADARGNLSRRLRADMPAPRVRLTIDANGRLEHCELATSSGSPAHDHAALLRVARAAPFTPPPSGTATIILPIALADAAQLAMVDDR